MCGQPVLFRRQGDTCWWEHLPGNMYGDHEPETVLHRRSKLVLGKRLQELFPSAVLAEAVGVPEIEHMVDMMILTPLGGRIAFEIQCADFPPIAWQVLQRRCRDHNISIQWILGLNRLKVKGKHPLLKTVQFPVLETTMLEYRQPLWYLDPVEREMIVVQPHPDLYKVADTGVNKIGGAPAIVRRYPLGQLRVIHGHLQVLSYLDGPDPDWPNLPARLQKKLP